MGLSYSSVQQTEEKIQLVMTHLGIIQGTAADDSSEDNTVMDTEQILDELSEVERKLAEKQPKSSKGAVMDTEQIVDELSEVERKLAEKQPKSSKGAVKKKK